MVVIFEWMVCGVLVFLVGSFMGAIYDISGYDNIYLTYGGMTGYNHTVYSNDFLSVKWIQWLFLLVFSVPNYVSDVIEHPPRGLSISVYTSVDSDSF